VATDATLDRPAAWNAGAWFGSQLGGTLWLAISAGVLAARSATVASRVFALFLIANMVGILLWRRRTRMPMFLGLQILLAAFWACSMAAILAIDRAGLWETLAVGGRNDMPASRTYVMLTVLVLALGVMFQFRARKQSAAARGGV
jgi:hypothetical protein